MKILAFVDLHGSERVLKELHKKVKEKPDIILCAGDTLEDKMLDGSLVATLWREIHDEVRLANRRLYEAWQLGTLQISEQGYRTLHSLSSQFAADNPVGYLYDFVIVSYDPTYEREGITISPIVEVTLREPVMAARLLGTTTYSMRGYEIQQLVTSSNKVASYLPLTQNLVLALGQPTHESFLVKREGARYVFHTAGRSLFRYNFELIPDTVAVQIKKLSRTA